MGCSLGLPLPVVVLGGVFGGYFAISEAAAVTALCCAGGSCALPGGRLATTVEVTVESMVMVGGIMLILGIALGFTNFWSTAQRYSPL